MCSARRAARSGPTIYAIPKGAPNRDAAYALIDYLLTPEINAKEVQAHGYPSTDSRTNKLLPKEMLENPILYPAAELLSTARIRRRRDADQSAARRDHGPLQGGLSGHLAASSVWKSSTRD